MFSTRNASHPCDRSRHHAACQRGAMFNAEGQHTPNDATRRKVLNTAPPGRAGRWRRRTMSTRWSGAERRSTLASSVAAPRPILTTNDPGHAGSAFDPTIIPSAAAVSRACAGSASRPATSRMPGQRDESTTSQVLDVPRHVVRLKDLVNQHQTPDELANRAPWAA